MKPTGYIVMEQCEEYQQALVLRTGAEYPAEGILDWGSNKEPRALFADRASAKAAIVRTDHYRLAFGPNKFPERKFCVVVPVLNVSAKS